MLGGGKETRSVASSPYPANEEATWEALIQAEKPKTCSDEETKSKGIYQKKGIAIGADNITT